MWDRPSTLSSKTWTSILDTDNSSCAADSRLAWNFPWPTRLKLNVNARKARSSQTRRRHGSTTSCTGRTLCWTHAVVSKRPIPRCFANPPTLNACVGPALQMATLLGASPWTDCHRAQRSCDTCSSGCIRRRMRIALWADRPRTDLPSRSEAITRLFRRRISGHIIRRSRRKTTLSTRSPQHDEYPRTFSDVPAPRFSHTRSSMSFSTSMRTLRASPSKYYSWLSSLFSASHPSYLGAGGPEPW